MVSSATVRKDGNKPTIGDEKTLEYSGIGGGYSAGRGTVLPSLY